MFTKISTMALLDASKADKKIMDDIVADEVKSDYNYTLKGLDTIGSMNMSIEAVPIMRDECGECTGKVEMSVAAKNAATNVVNVTKLT